MSDLAKIDPRGVYLVDNGACYCGAHLGASARFTGRDISGQPIYRISPRDMAEPGADMLACETCGAKPSRLF